MKKNILKLFSIAVVMFLTITNVTAKELVISDEEVIQQGTFDSIRFAFGKTVTNKAIIDGLSFAAGEKVVLKGETPYGFYAGKTIIFNETIEKDVFIAGKDITLGKNASIERDAFIAGKEVTIRGSIGRDLRVGSGKVDFRGATIEGNVDIDADKIIFDEDTKIEGKLTYPETAEVKGLTKETASKVKVTKVEKDKDEDKDKALYKISNYLKSSIRAFVVMLVLLFLIPKLETKLKEEEVNAKNVCKKSLIGLGILIFVPIIGLIALFTGLLSSLSLIVLVLYGVSLYIASIFVYFIVGNYLDKKFIKKDNTALSLLCGILAVKLVGYVTVLGAIISAICFLYGLGLIVNYINSIRKG